MTRFAQQALLVLGVAMFSVTGSSARIQNSIPIAGCSSTDPCATTARRDYYDDDCTQDRYEIITFCNCHTQLVYYRTQPKSPGFLATPSNFWALVATADWTTPGSDTGVYLIDSDGSHIMLRNPYAGEAEREGQSCTGLG